jgi:hypothetical protein
LRRKGVKLLGEMSRGTHVCIYFESIDLIKVGAASSLPVAKVIATWASSIEYVLAFRVFGEILFYVERLHPLVPAAARPPLQVIRLVANVGEHPRQRVQN